MKIFIISDLHLGGYPHPNNDATSGATSHLGSQICHAYAELTQFIDWVADQGVANGPVELVINGDIVDFLMEDAYEAEPDAVPWLPDEARVLAKLKLIITRTREANRRGPFDAMADLLKKGQLLTFILGNHDIELSLPAVRQYLEDDVFSLCLLFGASTIYPWSRWKALLLDDPLHHNDTIHSAAFVDVIRNLIKYKGYQIVVSTHDMEQAGYFLRKCANAGIETQYWHLYGRSKNGVLMEGKS